MAVNATTAQRVHLARTREMQPPLHRIVEWTQKFSACTHAREATGQIEHNNIMFDSFTSHALARCHELMLTLSTLIPDLNLARTREMP